MSRRKSRGVEVWFRGGGAPLHHLQRTETQHCGSAQILTTTTQFSLSLLRTKSSRAELQRPRRWSSTPVLMYIYLIIYWYCRKIHSYVLHVMKLTPFVHESRCRKDSSLLIMFIWWIMKTSLLGIFMKLQFAMSQESYQSFYDLLCHLYEIYCVCCCCITIDSS